MRSTKNKASERADDGKEYGLNKKSLRQLIKLSITSEDQLEGKRINDYFTADFFNSNF
jgi:oleate hydratase